MSLEAALAAVEQAVAAARVAALNSNTVNTSSAVIQSNNSARSSAGNDESTPVPARATGSVHLAPNAAVTNDDLNRFEDHLLDRLETDTAFTDVFTNLDEIENESERVFLQRWVSAGTYISRRKAETILKYFAKIFVRDKAFTFEDVLQSGKPPRHDLTMDRVFWKSICHLLIKRSDRFHNVAENLRAISTMQNEFIQLRAAYHRMTSLWVHSEVTDECEALFQQRGLPVQRRRKEIATAQDFRALVQDGVFGEDLTWRCVRERTQTAILFCLHVYTACRSAELVLGSRQTDTMKWKDIQFSLSLYDGQDAYAKASEEERPNLRLRLSCDVTLRNLKGMRNDMSKYRTQPLYSDDSIVPCQDATLLLAMLAQEDNVFASGVDIFEVMQTCDRSIFANDAYSFIEIPKNTSMDEVPVLRNIVHPAGETQRFAVSPSEPLTNMAARSACDKAASHAGFASVPFYVFRRMGLNKANDAKHTEDSRRQAASHRPGSLTFARSYQKARTTIDFQGAFNSGQERQDLLVEHGLRRTLPTILTTAEKNQIDQHPIVVGLRLVHDQKYGELRSLEQQIASRPSTDEERQRHQSLQKEVGVALRRLRGSVTYHRSKMADSIAERLLDERIVAVLNGAPRQNPTATDGNDEEDDDEEDENEDRDGVVNAGAVDRVVDENVSQELSRILGPEDEDVNESADADEEANPYVDPLRRSLLAIQLEEGLASLANEHRVDLAIEQPDFSILKIRPCDTDDGMIMPTDIAVAIYQSLGTKDAQIDAIDSLGDCPTCQLPLSDVAVSHANEKPSIFGVNKHIGSCSTKLALDNFHNVCVDTLSDQACLHSKCFPREVQFGTSQKDIFKHLDDHRKAARGYARCFYHHEDGELCTWTSADYDGNPQDSAYSTELAAHLEYTHGIPDTRSTTTVLCRTHRSWHFGLTQLDQHYSEHVDAILSTEHAREDDEWIQLTCPFCAIDERLSMAVRGHVFVHKSAISAHILRSHIYSNRQVEMQCPICRDVMHAADLPEHLRERHARNLGKKSPRYIGRNFALLLPMTSSNDAGVYDEWKQWIDQICNVNQDNVAVHQSTINPMDGDDYIAVIDEEVDLLEAEVEQSARDTSALLAISSTNINRNALSGGVSRGKESTRKQCPFCSKDEDLDDQLRQRLFRPFDLAGHIVPTHILYNRDAEIMCPDCEEEIDAGDFAMHLQEHGYSMSGYVKKPLEADLSNIFGHKKPKQLYIDWINAGCPEEGFESKRKSKGPTVKSFRGARQLDNKQRAAIADQSRSSGSNIMLSRSPTVTRASATPSLMTDADLSTLSDSSLSSMDEESDQESSDSDRPKFVTRKRKSIVISSESNE